MQSIEDWWTNIVNIQNFVILRNAMAFQGFKYNDVYNLVIVKFTFNMTIVWSFCDSKSVNESSRAKQSYSKVVTLFCLWVNGNAFVQCSYSYSAVRRHRYIHIYIAQVSDVWRADWDGRDSLDAYLIMDFQKRIQIPMIF